MSATSNALRVFVTGAEEARRRSLIAPSPANGKKPNHLPAHWNNESGIGFNNPWPSAGSGSVADIVKLVFNVQGTISKLQSQAKSLPVVKPLWRANNNNFPSHKMIHATWLGHACFFVEMPSSSSSSSKRGARILFDPVFSDRCSPVQFMGPKRFTPPPCSIDDIPDVDAVVISHNHYDHLDTATITQLFSRSRKPHIFAPLGNKPYFLSLGGGKLIPESHIHVMDWWESLRMQSTDAFVDDIDITCTPAQHTTGRFIHDQSRTLWSSWVVSSSSSASNSDSAAPPESSAPTSVNVFFAGDTGYRSVNSDDVLDDESLPYCPAFKEIGSKFPGGMDLALIPIGAYLPRKFMSRIHVSPPQSVRIFKDVGAKKALGMHWGTWVLTTEEVMDPARVLAEETVKQGLEKGQFEVCESVGETRGFEVE